MNDRYNEVRCPDCSSQATLIGPIPVTNIFAGRILEQPLSGGSLYRCQQCSLGFRWPRLSKSELDRLYEQGNVQTWLESPQGRRGWIIARGWLEKVLLRGKSILDIGCFDGGFLKPLAGFYNTYGIEIHEEARRIAEKNGIEIVGGDFSSIKGKFECVTAFDIIEHVEEPGRFLEKCFEAVPSGGRVLISTGNMDALTFKLMGSRYWYCTIAEHLSFISPQWISFYAEKVGYVIEKQECFAHNRGSLLRRVKEGLANYLYLVSPGVFSWLRSQGVGVRNVKKHPELADHPPVWPSAKDHFIVLLRKV